MVVISSKRKTSVARAHAEKGSGKIMVNSSSLDIYQPELLRDYIKEPVLLADGLVDLSKINISVNVYGGGVSGRSDAIRSAIARALIDYTKNEVLLKKYIDYDRRLIVNDVRQTEEHKPSQSNKGPRHKRQKSYR
ncbi:MAG: 30S ribosomal protein S9 [Candidatus Altiarchaeales archaeon A3]|nr:MAG: 30S ribosomal protein S9 [Candidatus Altiarchaeales archaeon A3]